MSFSVLLPLLIHYVPIAISAAAAAAAALPQGQAGAWGAIRGVIDTLALNFGNAENAPKPPRM
jgi:hypothetical protein